MRYFLLSISLLMVLLCPVTGLQAQSEAESSTLVVASQDGKHEHTLKVGDRLPYQVKGEAMQRKGRIESVQDSSVTVAGREVAFQDLETVVLTRGKKRPAGTGLIRHSLMGELIALVLFALAYWLLRDNTSRAQRGVFGLLIVLAFIIFPVLLLIGLLVRLAARKKYDLQGHWRIHKG